MISSRKSHSPNAGNELEFLDMLANNFCSFKPKRKAHLSSPKKVRWANHKGSTTYCKRTNFMKLISIESRLQTRQFYKGVSVLSNTVVPDFRLMSSKLLGFYKKLPSAPCK